MARTISRPSVAVVTLHALLRKYFAISVRVSRSSSTTRILGDAWAMPTFVGDSGVGAKVFCFQMFPDRLGQYGATGEGAGEKASLISLTLRWSCQIRTLD